MSATLEKNIDHRNDVEKTSSGEQSPQFDFCAFFKGHTRASGWFSDRFGKPRRHFCGDFYGYFDDEKFVFDEKLYYSDGVVEVRKWIINVSDEGIFTAESSSLINGARGLMSGNTLSMTYAMSVKISPDKSWDLDMKDLMILQPDNSLHNITQVHKWGIRIGTVSAQYIQHNGEKLCFDDRTGAFKAINSRQAGIHLSSVGSQAIGQ